MGTEQIARVDPNANVDRAFAEVLVRLQERTPFVGINGAESGLVVDRIMESIELRDRYVMLPVDCSQAGMLIGVYTAIQPHLDQYGIDVEAEDTLESLLGKIGARLQNRGQQELLLLLPKISFSQLDTMQARNFLGHIPSGVRVLLETPGFHEDIPSVTA